MKNKFLMIDCQMNTVLIDLNDRELIDLIDKNRITRHKTKKELLAEVSNYLKEGKKNETSNN